jgi:hypothetical protein
MPGMSAAVQGVEGRLPASSRRAGVGSRQIHAFGGRLQHRPTRRLHLPVGYKPYGLIEVDRVAAVSGSSLDVSERLLGGRGRHAQAWWDAG